MKYRIRPRISLLLAIALAFAPIAAVAAPQPDSASLSGRVFAADFKTPLAGIDVQLVPQGEKRLAAETFTDESGRFAVDGLPVGVYTVVLIDENFSPLAAAEIDLSVHEEVSLAVPEARPGEAAAAPAQAGGGGGFLAWLSTPLGATVALVAGATVVAIGADSLTDDEPDQQDTPVSPSSF